MPDKAKYLFVALPSSISPSGHKDDVVSSIQRAVKSDNGSVTQMNIPDFKVGTLDALIQQSEELGKIEGLCKNVVSKVGDALKMVFDGDEEQIARHKSVNDSMVPCLVTQILGMLTVTRTNRAIPQDV